MDATEPNPSEPSPPRVGVEMASGHWRICGNHNHLWIDGPATSSDGVEVVPRADAEALAHAVSAFVQRAEHSKLAKALSEYLAKHPWSDL